MCSVENLNPMLVGDSCRVELRIGRLVIVCEIEMIRPLKPSTTANQTVMSPVRWEELLKVNMRLIPPGVPLD